MRYYRYYQLRNLILLFASFMLLCLMVDVTPVFADPPTVIITSPAHNSNIAYGSTLLFTADAMDPEDGMLSGNDLVWTSAKDGFLGYGISFTKNNLSLGTHEITVTATDSANESGTASITMTISNASPEILITSPANNSTRPYNTLITFLVTVTDPEDGTLTGNDIVWSSDRDGFLGYGNSFTKNDLSLGVHIITVTATDSLEGTSTTSITVTIGNEAPVVEITAPANNSSSPQGMPITFLANATDGEDGVLTGQSVVWRSDLDGFLGYGTSLVQSDLSVGTHVITVTAKDSADSETTASMTVIVGNDAPVVVISSPADNSSFSHGAMITFLASATDSEDAVLTGQSVVWRSDRDGFLGYGTSLIQRDLSLGTHVISVAATDSSGVTTTVSITVTIGNTAPVALIRLPTSNSTANYGENITFLVDVTDREDGSITGKSIVWMSDRDGFLGYDTSFLINTLSVGVHSITVTATDSSDVVTTASVTLTIKDSSPGRVEITKPLEGDTFDFNDYIEFVGSATDNVDGALTGDNLIWTSNLDTEPIGTGETFRTNTLIPGEHLITLTATDSAGLSDKASILITVEGGTTDNIEIIKPAEGDIFSAEEYIEFVGNATGSDGESLDGESLVWTSNLVAEPLGTGKRLLTNSLESGSHLITLTATDNNGAVSRATVIITVDDNVPVVVEIVTPLDGEHFSIGEYIEFNGTATDIEDGDLRGESLVWTSNMETLPLGAGESFRINTLSKGRHLIMLTATDSQNSTSSDFIVISVDNTPPVPVITFPSDDSTFKEDEEITLTGYATDAEDGLLQGGALSWVSNLEGYLGGGGSTSVSLSPGDHVISLMAKDKYGDEESTTIQVTVEATELSLPLTLENTYVSLPLGQVGTVSISGGHPPYRYEKNYPHIADVNMDGHTIRVVPKEMGETTFQIFDHDNTSQILYLTVADRVENLPFADAGPDQSTVEGITVTLDGSASSPGSYGISSWQWEQLVEEKTHRMVLADDTAMQTTFVAPFAESVPELTFRLTVIDTQGSVSIDEVTIEVTPNAIEEYPEGVISFLTAERTHSLGVTLAGGGDFVSLSPEYPQFISENTGRPENMIYGLVDLKLKVNEGEQADMILYFPEPLEADYGLYKYSPFKGWYDYSKYVTYSADRTRAYVILRDGDVGDDDSEVNGIISDPITVGTAPISAPPNDSDASDISSSGGDSGGGCFISTLFY